VSFRLDLRSSLFAVAFIYLLLPSFWRALGLLFVLSVALGLLFDLAVALGVLYVLLVALGLLFVQLVLAVQVALGLHLYLL
jgi:hypothetical protein